MIVVLTEEREIKLQQKAEAMCNTLIDFKDYLRNEYKYNDNEAAHPIAERLYEIATENGLMLNELTEL